MQLLGRARTKAWIYQNIYKDVARILVGIKDVTKAKALQVEGWTLSPSLWKLVKDRPGRMGKGGNSQTASFSDGII